MLGLIKFYECNLNRLIIPSFGGSVDISLHALSLIGDGKSNNENIVTSSTQLVRKIGLTD